MNKKPMTHVVNLCRLDVTIKVRETEKYWISENGIKHDKKLGWVKGSWMSIDLSTLKPI